jgi:hypothetical protein
MDYKNIKKLNAELKYEKPLLNNEIKCEKPLLNNEIKCEKPLINNEIKCEKPLINNEIKCEKPLLNNEIKCEKPLINKNNECIDVKFELTMYNSPKIYDMAIIIAFFNPTNSLRIIQNLLLVKHYLEMAYIPFYIGELAFLDYPFILPKSNNILQVRSNSYMFYKENLITSVESMIPPHFTKICIMDADIMFDNKNWYSIISQSLIDNDICQPFNRANLLNSNFTIESTKTNCVDIILSKTDNNMSWVKNHVGFIWAFKREWFKNNYTEDRTVIGGGDGFLFESLLQNNTPLIKPDLKIYNSFLKKKIYNSISYCNLTIYHLFHGLDVNRQYVSRCTNLLILMNKNNITSLSQILIRRDDNILEWDNKYKQIINSYMINYFSNRHDDEITKNDIDNDKAYKFFPVIYSNPINKDMAVIMCYFNASKYIRIVQNILTVKNYMELSNIPFYISEVAFYNEPFLFKKESNIFQYRSESHLFYKENLNKIIVNKLPDNFTKLLFLDADIFFENVNWYTYISNKLNSVDILIPFKKAFWLNINYKVFQEKINSLDSKDIKINWDKEHVGFCLAVNKKEFHRIPAYETFMIGGDTQLTLYLKNKGIITTKQNEDSKLMLEFIPNITFPLQQIQFTYDSCNLNVFHLNHGAIVNRKFWDVKLNVLKYFKENNIQKFDDFLYIRPDGIYELNPKFKEGFNKLSKSYFDNRDEDNVL